jgi:hypothetical protein
MTATKKAINLQVLNELVGSFNETAVELNALMSWASQMQPNGFTSLGPKITKQRLTKIKKLVRELELKCKPARDTIQAIRDSGHFDRQGSIPLHFHKGEK